MVQSFNIEVLCKERIMKEIRYVIWIYTVWWLKIVICFATLFHQLHSRSYRSSRNCCLKFRQAPLTSLAIPGVLNSWIKFAELRRKVRDVKRELSACRVGIFSQREPNVSARFRKQPTHVASYPGTFTSDYLHFTATQYDSSGLQEIAKSCRRCQLLRTLLQARTTTKMVIAVMTAIKMTMTTMRRAMTMMVHCIGTWSISILQCDYL